jgi:hypothetical protein
MIGVDIIRLVLAALILTIFFFARQLLIERPSRQIIFGISLALFVTAVFLTLFNGSEPILFPSLMSPLISLGLFLLMRKLFVRWTQREPRDTFLDWRSGLAADRWFNILYLCLTIWVLFLLYVGAAQIGWKCF